jgi:pyrroline-5-carboxylate reductase
MQYAFGRNHGDPAVLNNSNIVFIGGGNMAASLVGGLVKQGCAPERITVTDLRPEQLQAIVEKFGVHITPDNDQAAHQADVLVFAVKPQVFRQAALPLRDAVHAGRPLVISIAAGIAEQDIRRWLGEDTAIVRAMPNTASLLGAGAAALYANPAVTPAQRQLAESILGAVGLVLWLEDESLLDAVTALSASGLAYFFLLTELMEDAGRKLDLPADAARRLTLQTLTGAARMAADSGDDAAALRQKVTSPGGTTAAALEVFDSADLRATVLRALTAARDRGRQLSREFSKDEN